MQRNKTKIVATIGPASSSRQVLLDMISKGMNVARMNFSHGKHKDHEEVIQVLREIDGEQSSHTAILADLSGPKIRVGELESEKVQLIVGETLELVSDDSIGTQQRVSVSYDSLCNDVKKGETILLDDGKLRVKVEEVKGDVVVTKVTQGGWLKPRKGVNLPESALTLPSLTDKDIVDLAFALKHNAAWVALSFVRTAQDIEELKHLIESKGGKSRVIAKIEKPEAVENIDEIIAASDGIMVARGDLGVEIPLQNVPLVQKEIVRKCQKAGKPVIIATQMMESMVDGLTPSRAEVNDVANSVMDGADAVMLSAETSVGKYPAEVVTQISKIITSVEYSDMITVPESPPKIKTNRYTTKFICYHAAQIANETKIAAITTLTHSGYTGFQVSSWRPHSNILVFTSNKRILCRLNLLWGVKAFYYDRSVSTDKTIKEINEIVNKKGFAKKGDMVINLASMPVKESGMVNTLKISEIK